MYLFDIFLMISNISFYKYACIQYKNEDCSFRVSILEEINCLNKVNINIYFTFKDILIFILLELKILLYILS